MGLRHAPSLHVCTCRCLLPRRCRGWPPCTGGEPTTSSPSSRAKTKAHFPWGKNLTPLIPLRLQSCLAGARKQAWPWGSRCKQPPLLPGRTRGLASVSKAKLQDRWGNLNLSRITGVSFSPSGPTHRFSSQIINHQHTRVKPFLSFSILPLG